jgi:flagellar motor switch protein FliG
MSAVDLRSEQKAAALVVAVGSKLASGLLQYLSEDEVEMLAAEVAKIGRLRPETIDGVFEEVYNEAQTQKLLASGGIDYARELLSDWKGSRGAEIIERLMVDINVTPFGFVRDIDPDALVHILKDEHAQTVALILAHQPASHAAAVLRGLEPEMQAEVALRVATMGRTSPDVIKKVEHALQSRLGNVSSAEVTTRGGIEDLAEVLNNTDRSTEKAILASLHRFDAGLADEVRALMFVFEDIVTLDDRSVQEVLKHVESKDLALAMKGIQEDVKDVILRNMSQRASEALLEEIELLGPARRSDVEAAQSSVVKVIRKLEDAGDIIISRGGESELIE